MAHKSPKSLNLSDHEMELLLHLFGSLSYEGQQEDLTALLNLSAKELHLRLTVMSATGRRRLTLNEKTARFMRLALGGMNFGDPFWASTVRIIIRQLDAYLDSLVKL